MATHEDRERIIASAVEVQSGVTILPPDRSDHALTEGGIRRLLGSADNQITFKTRLTCDPNLTVVEGRNVGQDGAIRRNSIKPKASGHPWWSYWTIRPKPHSSRPTKCRAVTAIGIKFEKIVRDLNGNVRTNCRATRVPHHDGRRMGRSGKLQDAQAKLLPRSRLYLRLYAPGINR